MSLNWLKTKTKIKSQMKIFLSINMYQNVKMFNVATQKLIFLFDNNAVIKYFCELWNIMLYFVQLIPNKMIRISDYKKLHSHSTVASSAVCLRCDGVTLNFDLLTQKRNQVICVPRCTSDKSLAKIHQQILEISRKHKTTTWITDARTDGPPENI